MWSFEDTDKSCKCEYCKRSFEIERNSDYQNNSSDNFSLNELKTPIKFLGAYLVGSYISSAIIGIIVFAFIGFVGFTIFKEVSRQLNNSEIVEKEKNKYFSNVSELSNDDYEDLDDEFDVKSNYRAEGVNNAYHSYIRNGDPKREVIYIASKKDSNVIVGIYRVYFYDFFHQENRYTLYVPIVFENIKKNDLDKFKNSQIKAPEYYFNSEKSSYSYGYSSLEEAYNNVVAPLEKDYKISNKNPLVKLVDFLPSL